MGRLHRMINRDSGLLAGAEGEAGGADVFPAVAGLNGCVPLAGHARAARRGGPPRDAVRYATLGSDGGQPTGSESPEQATETQSAWARRTREYPDLPRVVCF